MTDLAAVTANKADIVESVVQDTQICAVAVAALQAVRYDTSTGNWQLANATTAPNARVYGIATRTAAAGEACTAIRRGVIDGLDLSALAYDAAVYLSDTAGTLANAAGTVTAVMGRVIPARSQRLGASPDKVLHVEAP